jgi:hypothetical protein
VIIDVWLIMLIYANGGALQNSADKIMSEYHAYLILLSVNGSFNLFQAVGKNHGKVQHNTDPTSEFVWKSSAPPRIQFFMWLLSKGKIQCRANLFKKRIVGSPCCEVCGAAEETADHIILTCPFARDFWNEIGLQLSDELSTRNIQSFPSIGSIPQRHYSTFIALCCWQLWKRRNAVIFRNESNSLRQVLQACCYGANAWRPRLKRKHRQTADFWCNLFQEKIDRLT